MSLYKRTLIFCFVLFASQAGAQPSQQTANKPDRVAWFQDLGFGMFIHWNVDVSLGVVISHSLAGASDEYVEKYKKELPAIFNPQKFNPDEWARIARLAGMKYVVFTAKHHSGFCMFNTKTTSFNVMNTPFKRDVTREIIEAFRKQGIAIGLYFSPEDFNYFYEHKIPIGRLQLPMHYPMKNPGLMEHDKKQVQELLTNYGKIDIFFFDGPGDGLREFAWKINPDLVITRDAMNTPEQKTPDEGLPRPWEACYTMGTDWQYKPTNDPHKSGTEIINKLVEIRAKGGNFLLNVGPKADGEIQLEQQALLQEVALWNFANSEAIYRVKPLPVIREENIMYTQSNDEKYIYAFVLRSSPDDWKFGERKNFVLTHLQGNANTNVSILGYKSELVEYKVGLDAKIYTESTPTGLVISAVNGQRFYTDRRWPNTVVLKIENATFRKINNTSTQSQMDGAK
jgi:alpha-L-fucosidase